MNQRLVQRLEEIVLQRIAEDKVFVPTMPVIAAKCLELLEDPNFDFKDVAALVEREPLVAARALRMAQSAAFPAATKALNLTWALARLGAKALRTLMLEAAAHKLFMSRDRGIAQATKAVWDHSVAVAVMARDIAAVVGSAESETAYLAGLLHDVGKPLVAAVLLEAERQVSEGAHGRTWMSSSDWLEVVRRTHHRAGTKLAERWNLPETVRRCIRDCSEYDTEARGAMLNAVCLANALAKQEGLCPDGADLEDAKALVMIGRSLLGVDDHVLTALVANMRERVTATAEDLVW